ncbi:MAG: PQQ-binding-like beta-propeller repeat protein [Planctomycetaceae bacterium]|nr:PQQ-binding-like beta-propeller repeat protein [Planctomycetaceae bacterium]
MNRIPFHKLSFFVLGWGWLLLGMIEVRAADENWPQWRGPLGTGAAPQADPPVEWSETKNVRWKTALPGKGHSTPIVWGDRIFLTTAVPMGEKLPPKHSTAPGTHDGVPVTQRHEFVVLAVNRRDGKILWQKSVHQKLPHEGGHYTGSLASNSALTDGEHVFAFFGSHGLYCLGMNGELKWQKQFGEMQTKHGHGESASPVLHGDLVFVNWDHDGPCFVAAFDKRTGQQRWKVERDEETSWSSPIVVENDGQPMLIVAGTNRVRAYAPATGTVLWECGGLSSNIVATPVAAEGMLFAGSSYEKKAFLAIRLDRAKGDITGSDRIAWTRSRGTPYVPSPLLYGDALYFLTHYQGILSRVDAVTGADKPGAIRLGSMGNIYASPVAGGGRVYVTDLDGKTIVMSHDDQPKVLAINILDEEFAASAALVGRELFLRGKKHLYCIAEDAEL